MLKTLIVLPNGTEIYSGTGTTNEIQSCKFKESVNSAKELLLGSVCSSMLEVKIFTPNGGLNIEGGDEITAYKVSESGIRTLVGNFTVETPTRPSPNTMKIVAYDRATWLDKDLTAWLAGLQNWPYSLYDFAGMVCNACGLILANDSMPNGDYMIRAFSGAGVTGRKLMQWVGEVAGRFCRATPEGEIEFAWYEPSGVSIAPDGDRFYYQNGLTYEDYPVAPIEKVQIKLTQNDVGVVWPNETGEKNTYVISGNYLLTTASTAALQPIAQTIYEQLKDVVYTPCKVVIPASTDLHAGHIVSVTDRNGNSFTTYVMAKTQNNQRDTLECTGSRRRDSTTVVNNISLQALSGKMLEVQQAVEGFSVTASEIKGSAIYATVDEFYLSVSPFYLEGGEWNSEQPHWVEEMYLWRRSRITKGDGTISYAPSEMGVCITGNTGADGKDGEDGKDGKNGTDGVGVQSTSCTYQVSDSGTNVPTGIWLNYIPSVGLGQYLWTRTVIWYTDETSSTSYSVGYNGTDGTDGTDGNTSYLHIKYSDDGETFTDNNGNTLGAWIGTLVDFNEDASTVFSDYTWKKFTEDVDDEIENLAGSIQIIRESVGQLTVEDELIRTSVSDLLGLVNSNTGEIQQTREQISSINQTAEEIELKIETINNDGVSKVRNTTGTFNEKGLEIDSTDSTTKTQITPDGMEVFSKSGAMSAPVLSATSAGVDATNLHAKTYLIIGGRSRFENYGSNRTGCFWIGD